MVEEVLCKQKLAATIPSLLAGTGAHPKFPGTVEFGVGQGFRTHGTCVRVSTCGSGVGFCMSICVNVMDRVSTCGSGVCFCMSICVNVMDRVSTCGSGVCFCMSICVDITVRVYSACLSVLGLRLW